jgi:hypothetical protein
MPESNARFFRKRQFIERLQMETALESITSLSGVSCALYFDPQIGIVSRKSDPDFTEENLTDVGRIVEKLFSWGTELFSDLEQIRLHFDDSAVLVVKPDGSPYLVVIHEIALDENLLKTTLAQAVNRPGAKLGASAPAAGPAAAAESQPAGQNEADRKKLEELLASGPASQVLSTLEKSLNKVMGPMAAIVFSDARQTWIERIDHVSKASIDILVQMLCNEIGDQEKIETFRELVVPHMEGL